MPFCATCGTENPDGARFCAKCGNAMSAAPQTAPQAPPPAPQPAPQAAPQPAPKAAPKPGFANGPDPNAPNQTQFFMAAAGVSAGSKVKRILLFVVVAMAIGTGAFFLLRFALDKKEAAAPAKTEASQETAIDPATDVAPAKEAVKTPPADDVKADEAKAKDPKDNKKSS